MFDLGLSKLALIGVVALVVVGPEKLPKVARMAGALFGRAQRYINDVKSEVSREMALDDLHRLRAEMQDAAQQAKSGIENLYQATRATVASDDPPADESALAEPSLTSASAKAKNFRRSKTARASVGIAAKGGKRRGGLRSSAARASLNCAGGKSSVSFL